MSNKYRAELEALSADEVTERLGDFYEKQLSALTDKNTGVLRTAFSLWANMYSERSSTLVQVALEKNGVEGGGPYGVPVALIEATQARGSDASRKISNYLKAVETINTEAKAAGACKGRFLGKLKDMQISIEVAKRRGPGPA